MQVLVTVQRALVTVQSSNNFSAVKIIPKPKRTLKGDSWTLFYFSYLWALQKMSLSVKIKTEKDKNQFFNYRLFLDYFLKSWVGNRRFKGISSCFKWIFFIIIQLSNVALCFKLQKAGLKPATFINLHYIASGQNSVSQF